MTNTMVLNTKNKRIRICIWALILVFLFLLSLFIGKYPLSVSGILNDDKMQRTVFFTLRLPRTVVSLIGGVALGVTGFVFQTVFRNPLASPDIIGISSGASAGAAFGILFFNGSAAVLICSFSGAVITLFLVILLATVDKGQKNSTFVISGIIVHSIAQSALMIMKVCADPEKELASIEYWIMGSLSSVSSNGIFINLCLCTILVIILFFIYRRIILLSLNEDEVIMLGVNVSRSRFLILFISTLTVSTVISITGLISFIGLLPAHIARRTDRSNSRVTMLLSGLIGGCILIMADIFARSISSSELPVSIFTSLIGAPILIFHLVKGRHSA